MESARDQLLATTQFIRVGHLRQSRDDKPMKRWMEEHSDICEHPFLLADVLREDIERGKGRTSPRLQAFIAQLLGRIFAARHGLQMSLTDFGSYALETRSQGPQDIDDPRPMRGLDGLWDHPVSFKETTRPYRPAMLVGAPYDGAFKSDFPGGEEEARERGLKRGLDIQFPKDFPSFWYPGRTILVTATRLAK